jgi:hypothetical protein
MYFVSEATVWQKRELQDKTELWHQLTDKCKGMIYTWQNKHSRFSLKSNL